MAKNKDESAVDRVAEAVGHALGAAAGTIESLHAQHPHPIDEVREALAAAAFDAGTRATVMIKKAKTVERRAKKVVTRARRKSKPAVTRTARKAVKRASKAIKRGRKTARRVAKRLKR